MNGDKKLDCEFRRATIYPLFYSNHDGRHCTGFSNIIIYHNQGREGDARILADSDIVLSTYHTISHEATDKTSPLYKINWFRIILDEGNTGLSLLLLSYC